MANVIFVVKITIFILIPLFYSVAYPQQIVYTYFVRVYAHNQSF
jgi:hypothetical protein